MKNVFLNWVKINSLILFCVISNQNFAQNLNTVWANGIGNTATDESRVVATDSLGNVLIAGAFESTVDFDPGTGVFNLTSNGQKDIFVQKVDSEGNFLWAISFGAEFTENVTDIMVNASGEIYICGSYVDTVDFDPGTGVFQVVPNTLFFQQLYLLKLDSNGGFMWVKNSGGQGNQIYFSMEHDNDWNLYLTGTFTDTVDFDPSPAVSNLSSNISGNAFIQKLDANGNFIWVKAFGYPNSASANDIAYDQNDNLYITGLFYDSVDFDPSAVIFNEASNGDADVYVLKLDTSGHFIWVKTFGGSEFDNGTSVTCDINNNVIVTGRFADTVDFDPGTGVSNLISNGIADNFLLKLDENGLFVWAGHIGGILNEGAASVITDKVGNIYLSSTYFGSADLDPGVGVSNYIAQGSHDFFVEKLDSNGSLIWVRSYGGAGSDNAWSLLVDKDTIIYLAGNFSNIANFASNAVVNTLTSSGGFDAFVMKIKECYTGDIDLSITTTNGTLSSNSGGLIYQWLDCNNSFAEIVGETQQDFTPTVNGDYALVLYDNGCVDTSICLSITDVSLESHLNKNIVVYPNPSSGSFFIDLNEHTDARISIYDLTGRLVYSYQNETASTHECNFDGVAGTYILMVSSKEGTANFKIVID